jgi:phage baseplate assembly protein W
MQQRPTNSVVYKDFDLNMRCHPITGKLFIKKNDESLKQALKNLILTDLYERPFRSDFGSSIREALFENYTDSTESQLKDNIETAIANYEPRIDLLNITLSGDPDSHTLTASIVFRGKNSTEISEATISLDRIR